MGINAKKLVKYAFYGVVFCVFHLGSNPAHAVLDKARQAGFVPHKALYDVVLESRKNGSQISNIAGQMFYEWKPSCDAWISNHRFDVTYDYSEGASMRITSDFSTYESFDGKSMSFTSKRKRNGMVFEELRGNAGIEEGAGEAVYSMPPDLVFELPEGTLFPMAHTLDVMEKIKNNKKFYKATIFDGSDADGPVDINSFIAKEYDTSGIAEGLEKGGEAFVENKAWFLRLAFFPLHEYSAKADYEMDLVFHENGVISDMVVEYEDFAIRQKLVAIEPMEDVCGEEENE